MNKIKKVLSVCFAFLLLATVTVTGTLAYENISAYEWARQTDQTVSVKLVQEQRAYDDNGGLIGLEDFEDDKVLVPLVESAQYDGTNFDKYGMPTVEGYVDQIVRVKNEGTASAYVRVIVAIPAVLDDANATGHNALHWNLGNRFMADGSFGSDNDTNTAFADIFWKYSETAVVDEVECNIYIFTYKNALVGGFTTEAAAFVGFYLDHNVDVVNGHILLGDVDTGYMDDTVRIYVETQAVLSDGFSTAEEAFTTVQMPNNPWK